jgi:hypothetical protein
VFWLLKRLRDGRLHSEDWCINPRTGEEFFVCWLPRFWAEYVGTLVYWPTSEPSNLRQALRRTCGLYFYLDELERELGREPQAQSNASSTPKPTSNSPAQKKKRDREPPIKHRMIRYILEKRFPGKGPAYKGIATTILQKAVKAGWAATCKVFEAEHLINSVPKRDMIEYAIGRNPH